ncbi:hypothetical protein BHYA_0213g00070 [Botrytis hyacinthi]|uniref:Uncharacterized protein n=1 Tax=Botrytis hyacinthi TaxID=278943 RepID=A0A4Z1GDC2_9HELO|nr:hypothetical protein BHYA_0213g00070 [Botrytis hyacinthi]
MSRRDQRQAMIRVMAFAPILARLCPKDRLGLAVKIPYTAVFLPSDHLLLLLQLVLMQMVVGVVIGVDY